MSHFQNATLKALNAQSSEQRSIQTRQSQEQRALSRTTEVSHQDKTMNGKTITCVIFICLTCAALTEGMALKSLGTELRCQCINKESRFIHPKRIQNVELFPSGPHCGNAEVIATMKTGKKICLEPTAPWVKILIKAIMENQKL
uniref:Chemokine interleukin-8-like domain-containing protein n=1 Tax=Lepisosteus oculatus TaxID=7918 RepID=W5N751_LEPOC